MKTKMKLLSVLLTTAVLMSMTACGSPDNAAEMTGKGAVTDVSTDGSTEANTTAKESTTAAESPTAAKKKDVESEAKAAGQTVVYAATPQELQDALKSNTMIVLEGKDYIFEYGLDLESLENITIHGTTGTKLMTTSSSDDIINFVKCKGMALKNLVMGHDVPVESECTVGVVYVYTSDLTLDNCDIFGCGLIGISADQSTITAKNTTIRDCSYGLLEFFDSGAVFENCTFSGSGNEYSETAVTVYRYEINTEILFSGCNFTNNKNSKLYKCIDSKTQTEINNVTFKNCSYSGNNWGNTAP